jgi:hypothetical protein
MVRWAIRILGVLAALIVGTWAVLSLMVKPVTQEEARSIAIAQVHRSGQQLRFNASVFEGPQLVDQRDGAFAFQWRFSDHLGDVDMLVWVDEHGGSEISWKGDLERLKTR